MMARMACSECGKRLEHKLAKTCSKVCRARRSRRIKRAERQRIEAQNYPDHLKHLSEVTNREVKSAVHEVTREELRPLVREAMTEDVLTAINKLIGLTPQLVENIERDLTNADDAVRQRAYTLLAKYTLGNPSVAPPSLDAQPAPMQVVFQVPRPGDSAEEVVDVQPAKVTEVRQCCECKEHKPVDRFVATSERCVDCHEALQAKVRERFGE